MGNRLSRLYTRTGDDGTTGLAGGTRVDKDSERISAIGSVDELNSALGLLIAKIESSNESSMLLQIQHHLFNVGGELSMPGYELLDESLVDWLESNIDQLTSELGPLEEFILPGGSEAAATCHLARGIARRAERDLVSLRRIEAAKDSAGQSQGQPPDQPPGDSPSDSPRIWPRDCLLIYLNRLSDLLFVLARQFNRADGTQDILWDKSLAVPNNNQGRPG
jgi:cob(I)alamin adenosyltransferase